MKIGLALGSGGSKGAYQVGFFQAIKELNMPYHVITGASIGALNGAIMAQGDLSQLERLWHNLELKKVMKYGINLDLEEILKSDKGELLKFIASYIKNRGIDISPFKDLIATHLDIAKLRASPVEFGVTVATYPKITGRDIIIKNVPQEDIADYLLASASCFPAFPVTKIHGEQFIDGAYHDRLPIDLAFELGAEHVIAVDLNTNGYSHPEYLDHGRVTYIRSYHDLGPFMLIKPDVMARNIRLGYLDTMRKFGRFLGYKYAFRVSEVYDELATRALKVIDGAGIPELSGFMTLRIKDTLTPRSRYLRFLEVLAEATEIDPLKIYDIPQMRMEINQAIIPNQRYEDWLRKKPSEQQFFLSKMKEPMRLGLIKGLAEAKLTLSPATMTMLALAYPELYYEAIFYGLIF